MSGDVQPRKRKDKRRKKEESFEDLGSANPEEVIHVQKDAHLGGNICAKIVFFCLLGAIGVMVGLIIVEYRGATDSKLFETQSAADSPWSQMLEGWVDTSSVHGDDHGHEEESLDEGSGEDHSGEDLHEEHDDEEGHDNDEHEDHEDEENEDGSEEEDHELLNEEVDDDHHHNISDEVDENEDEDEDDEDEKEEDVEDDDEELGNDEDEEDEEEQNESEELLNEQDEEDEDNIEKENESEEVDDDIEQDDNQDEETEDKDDDIPGVTESAEVDDNDDQNELEDDKGFKDEDEHHDDIENDEDKEEEEEDKEESVIEQENDEEGDDGDEEKDADDLEEKKETEVVEETIEEKAEEETSGGEESAPAVHNETASADETSGGDLTPESLSRRQTLVPPTTLEELPPVKPPSPVEEPEYSNDEEEDEEPEEEEEEESEKIKQTIEELKETYSHLTPEGSDLEEDDYDIKPASKNYSFTPTPPESEPEEQSEPEEDEEEEEEEEDPMRQWQSRQAADLLAEEVEDVQTGTEEEEEEESDDEPPPVRRKGPQDTDEPYQHSQAETESKVYINAETTNQYDWEFHEELDIADMELNEGHAERALTLYSSLLVRAPNSPRAHHGKAQALDYLAEKHRSNQLLVKAVAAYKEALDKPDIPDKLFINIANRTINRMRFKGMHLDAVKIHNKLIARFQSDPQYRSELAVTYLMINRLQDAKMILETSLQQWPKDGLTNALYGLLLKLQGHYASSVPHLRLGISSNENGTQESNFFFHLGDALVRIGRPEEAMKIYEEGTAKGLFRSKYQRSLYNVDRLKSRPWWTPEQTTYQNFFRTLENNWETIKNEGLSALKAKKGFLNESESLRKVGDWKQFEIFARGQKSEKNCKQTPFTCRVIESFTPASGCRRGQTKFSVMEGGTHVWAHCGPTNTRLRAHLGLIIPPKTFIRVAEEIRSWQEGKIIIFDDSFEHEVWHNGTEQRLVLIVDVWHPELTEVEKHTLSAI